MQTFHLGQQRSLQRPHPPSGGALGEPTALCSQCMDESVIVGYYTLKKCLSVTPRCLQIPKKGQKAMARNDGINRTVARNQDLPTPDDVEKIQEHNEREKDSYSNQDIVPERTSMNVHFKAPTDDYVKM